MANLLYAFRDTGLIKFFLWVTVLGRWQIIFSSVFIVSILCWLWKRKTYIPAFWITIAGAGIFNTLGKLAVHRIRPSVAFYTEKTFSFPSGHATIAVALYGFIAYILFREFKQWKYKLNAVFITTLVILAIGLSRLYLGVHFLSDVWGGYLLGLLWLIIGISIAEWLLRRQRSQTDSIKSPKQKALTAGLILVEIIFYILFAFNYHPLLISSIAANPPIITDNIVNTFQNEKLPRYTETLLAENQEPLTFIITARDDQELIGILQRAGWNLADPATVGTVSKLAKAAMLNEAYPTAPITPSLWNGVVHNFGFEKPTSANNVRERHHARFWRASIQTKDGKQVYVGTASLDRGIKWLVTHTISPDIDTEREFLFADLQSTGLISESHKEQFVEPILGKNFSGDQFFTDGKLYTIILK